MYKRVVMIGLLVISVLPLWGSRVVEAGIGNYATITWPRSFVLDGTALGLGSRDCPLDSFGKPTCTVIGKLDQITGQCNCVNPAGNGIFPGSPFLGLSLDGQVFLLDTELEGKGKEPINVIIPDSSINSALESAAICKDNGTGWLLATETNACVGDDLAGGKERAECIFTHARLTFIITYANGSSEQKSWSCDSIVNLNLNDAPYCPEDFSGPTFDCKVIK